MPAIKHEKLINLVLIHLIRRAENSMFTAFFLPLQVFVGLPLCVHSKGQKKSFNMRGVICEC